jgi:hypothetical protein
VAAAQIEGRPFDKRSVQAVLTAQWRAFRAARAEAAAGRRDDLDMLAGCAGPGSCCGKANP